MAVMPAGLERLGSEDYDEYLKHQAAKLEREIEHGHINEYESRYESELSDRLRRFKTVHPGMSVLCLGAKLGAEVRAFTDCGCFAIGLDLNPGEKNKWVVYGDFQKIQFIDHSVDAIFTNAVDHVFDLGVFIGEILRVLKPDGLLIMDIARGRAEGVKPRDYESLWWEKIDDILAPFLAGRVEPFSLIARTDIEWPWAGQHVVLKRMRMNESN